MELENFTKLANLVKTLPGVGKKQSEKIAFYLVNNPQNSDQLMELIHITISSLKKCVCCNLLSKVNEQNLCDICVDVTRDNKLLIVESSFDLNKFEKMEFYKGKYFILEKMVEDIHADVPHKFYKDILNIINNKTEIILALSPTFLGELNSQLIIRYFKEKDFEITQLAQGIPLGAQVEYIDELTLKLSLKERRKM